MESTFSSPDIVCEGCAGAIRKALGAIEGVTDVGVDVAAKRVAVEHDPRVSRAVLAAACKQKFDRDPGRYLGDGPDRAAHRESSGEGATAYTCPMHPEVVRDVPGSCPLCGMALEPMVATGAEEASPELAEMGRRFWV